MCHSHDVCDRLRIMKTASRRCQVPVINIDIDVAATRALFFYAVVFSTSGCQDKREGDLVDTGPPTTAAVTPDSDHSGHRPAR